MSATSSAYSTAIPPGPPSEFPALEVRVCDLHVLSSPAGSSDFFTVDGLYVVLRFGSQIQRTECLWESNETELPDQDRDDNGGQFLSFEDTTWNEMFVFSFNGDDEEPSKTPDSRDHHAFPGTVPPFNTPGSILGGSLSASPSLSSVPGPNTSGVAEMRSTPPSLRTPSTPRGPPQASLEVELWRSTTDEESHIGWYRFALCNEFGAAQASKTVVKNGVLDKVVPLQNASAFDHRLGVRLRVRAFGVSFVPSTASGAVGILGHSGRVPLYSGLYNHGLSASSQSAGLLGYPSGILMSPSATGNAPPSILSRPGMQAGPSASSIYPVPATGVRGVVGPYGSSGNRGILGVGTGGARQVSLLSHTLNAPGASGGSGGSSPALMASVGPLHEAGNGLDGQAGIQLPTTTGALFPSAPMQGTGSVLPPPSTNAGLFGHPGVGTGGDGQ